VIRIGTLTAENKVEVAKDVVNRLLPGYAAIHSLKNALAEGKGDCFARMKLGGTTLRVLNLDQIWWHGIVAGNAHGLIVIPSLLMVIDSMMEEVSIDRTKSPYVNEVSCGDRMKVVAQRMMSDVALASFFGGEQAEQRPTELQFGGWEIYSAIPSTEISYPASVMAVVQGALGELGCR
jgi:hypothetical protein